jgi:hypothetical protein
MFVHACYHLQVNDCSYYCMKTFNEKKASRVSCILPPLAEFQLYNSIYKIQASNDTNRVALVNVREMFILGV